MLMMFIIYPVSNKGHFQDKGSPSVLANNCFLISHINITVTENCFLFQARPCEYKLF